MTSPCRLEWTSRPRLSGSAAPLVAASALAVFLSGCFTRESGAAPVVVIEAGSSVPQLDAGLSGAGLDPVASLGDSEPRFTNERPLVARQSATLRGSVPTPVSVVSAAAASAAGTFDSNSGMGVSNTGSPAASSAPAPMVISSQTPASLRVSCGLACSRQFDAVNLGKCDALFVSVCSEGDAQCVAPTALEAALSVATLDKEGRKTVLSTNGCDFKSQRELPAVDLLFMIDTTDDMGTPIASFVNGLDVLVAQLTALGVRVRLAGMAFGDQVPLRNCAGPDAPYSGFSDAAVDATDITGFRYWANNLSAAHCFDRGGDTPENALDAIEFGLGKFNGLEAVEPFRFAWDPQALHWIVLVTNAPQHSAEDGSQIAHFDVQTVTRDLQGFAQVFSLSPDFACDTSKDPGCVPAMFAPYADMATLARATGGAFLPLPKNGLLELSALPLAQQLLNTVSCRLAIPSDAGAVHCTYSDAQH